MKHQSLFPDFASTQEQEAQSAPALRLRLPEIVAEYVEKAESIAAAIKAFNDAETTLKNAASIRGSYGGNVFSREPHLQERHVYHVLLCSAWKFVYDGLNIEAIASAKDRKQLDLKLSNPPPFTMMDIEEVFGDYMRDPRFHILKGLAECFCDLDPAYKSHSKVKIGVEGLPKRIIVSHVSGWNSWGRERVKDTFNALRAYRGLPRYEYAEFEEVMKEAKRCGEADFCGGIVRVFKNDNAHIIFNAEALKDINRALAEFYGEVLPDAPSEAQARRPSTEVARDLQFYPTPRKVAETVIHSLNLQGGESVLEPSCGDGRIMDVLAEWHESPDGRFAKRPLNVTGVEYDAARAEQARAKGHHVMTANFLQVAPDPRFDVVVMNPPFYGQHYKKHLDHAIRFLREGGYLVCILPASAHYDHGNSIGQWYDLPVGSFAASGTNIPTGYCVYRKP